MKYVAILLAVFAVSVSAKAIQQKGFLDDMTAALMDVYNQVLFPAINTQIQNVSLLGAQLLAGISMSGLSGLTDLIGKRDVKGITDFFTNLGNQLVETLYPTVDQLVSTIALTGAQLLAGIAINGVGKRDAKGFLDDLTSGLMDVYNQVLFPAINTQVQNVALLGAQLLAGISMSGLGGLTDLFGKREAKDFWSDLGNQLLAGLMPAIDGAVSSLALTGAQLLAGIAINGVGKRDAKGFTDFITDLGNQLYQGILPTLDTLVSSIALTGAQLLAGIAINGVGKRDEKFIDELTSALMDVYNQVLFPAINTQIQNISLLGAQLLAGISMSGLSGLTDLFGRK